MVVTEDNTIYSLSNKFLSARRPVVPDYTPGKVFTVNYSFNNPLVDPEYLPYNPLMVIDHKNTVTRDQMTSQIESVVLAPSEFESTFIMCINGKGVVCKGMSPEKTFDRLNLIFPKHLILLVLIVIVVVSIYFKRKLKEKKAHFDFLNR